MNETEFGYSYLVLGIVVATIFGLLVYIRIREIHRGRKRSLLDYLLIWPLVIEYDFNRNRKSSISFILFGVVVMAILILISFWMHPNVR